MSREGKRGSRQRRVSRERQKEIERDNVILLQKMMKINEKGGRNGETCSKMNGHIITHMCGHMTHMCGNDLSLWLENGPIHSSKYQFAKRDKGNFLKRV